MDSGDGGAAVGPDGVNLAVERRDALVVAVLVAEIGAGDCFIGRRGRDLLGYEAGGGELCKKDVGRVARRVVAGVVDPAASRSGCAGRVIK